MKYRKPHKMQYEYSTYVDHSHFTLQYFTFHIDSIDYTNEKYTKYMSINYELHNEYGPAITTYYQDGTISRIEYWKDNKRHNEHGPAVTTYCPDGTIACVCYYTNDRLHNDTEPALIRYYHKQQVYRREYYTRGMYIRGENYPTAEPNITCSLL